MLNQKSETKARAAAYGIYPHHTSLTDVIQGLNSAGFHSEDICIVVSARHAIASVVREARVLADAREANAGSAALIAWLSELGAVVIPTVGFFIRSQAFFRALLADDSPAQCGSPRTLLGLGFSARDALRYESQLDQLGALIYVSCSDDGKTVEATELLHHLGGRETASLSMAPVCVGTENQILEAPVSATDSRFVMSAVA